MPRPANDSTVRAVAARAFADRHIQLVALSAAPEWDGPPQLDTEVGPVQVHPCVSPLAAREVVASVTAQPGARAVILTDLRGDALGSEVLARLWKHRVVSPSGWEALQELFRAAHMDPALADHRWLVDLLVEVAPAKGYAPPRNGLLDLDTAWTTFLRHGLRIDAERPRLTDLLRWGDRDTGRPLVAGRIRDHLDKVAERLGGTDAVVAHHIFRLVADGRGADLVPIGLVCDVLWNEFLPEAAPLHTARGRFEAVLGARGLTGQAARAWGEAAVSLVRRAHALSMDADRTRWAGRAEAILGSELDALPFAHASDVLPRGFDQRLEQAGRTLLDVLQRRTEDRLAALDAAVTRAGAHLRTAGALERERVVRLTMAQRAVRRWGESRDANPPTDLADAARAFVSDGAWVDRVREALGHGETVEPLAQAFHRVLERLDAERLDRDRRFATLLAQWSKVAPGERPPLLPVERVLDQIVVPAARAAPVLLVVLDGWSLPLSFQLLDDLSRSGWQRLGPQDDEHPIVVSALPSVTSVSRASLLSGRLAQGGQDVERAGWEAHLGLLEVCARKPAQLFHKADLAATEGQIAREVQAAILDPDVRVVGVVVNAIDEHLDRGGQLRLAQGLHALRPLSPLLEAAMEAGRIVVLTSDHGHVLEAGSRVVSHGGAGERWRPAHPPPEGDEVLLRGPRVLMLNSSIVTPATETVRYISAKKHGYHGGATPQEVLCPLALVAPPGTALPAWGPFPSLEPWWWNEKGGPVVAPPSIELPGPEAAVLPAADARGQTDMFGAPSSRTVAEPDAALYAHHPAWLSGLLVSPVLAAQRKAAGRQSLSDEDVAALLLALDSAGGVARVGALAAPLGLSPYRVQTKAATLRRLLNIDGYAVIEVEGDGTIRFDRELLVKQFGLSP